MASEWQRVMLGNSPIQIIDGDRGRNYPKKDDFLPYGDCLFLNAGNVTSNGFNFSKCMFITKEKDAKLRKGKLSRYDVVLTTRGTVGNVAYYDGAIVYDHIRINSGMVILRADQSKVLPRFLYLFLRSQEFSEQVTKLRTGSAQPQLPIRDIKRISIPLPPLPEQRAIAHILGTLDDQIETLRRMNETLEGIARALFKAWFVDFEPIRAKMSGRWRRDVGADGHPPSLPGLPADLYDLFPDKLVPSELGEIPEGWKVSAIGNEVKVVGGGTPSTKEPRYWENGTHFFATPKDLSKLSSPILLETERKVTDAGLAKISSGLLPTNTVLLSSRAPVGYLALTQVPVCINQGFIAMICDKTLRPYYVLLWAQSNMNSIKGRASGTTFSEISKKNFRPIPVIVPDYEVLQAFDELIAPAFEKITANLEQSRTLAALRDALLPELISGRLRLADAEKFLQERGL